MNGDVFAYWDGLRAGRLVPMRADVDPRGIERSLDRAFIVELLGSQTARFRIAGMFLNDLLGIEARGMPLSSLFTASDRPRVDALAARVFSSPEAVDIGVASASDGTLEGNLILLPLRSDLGDISRALGCITTRGEAGKVPSLLRITAAHSSRIELGRPVDRPVSPVHDMPPRLSLPGLAEDLAAFLGPANPRPPVIDPETRRARLHLRLVAATPDEHGGNEKGPV